MPLVQLSSILTPISWDTINLLLILEGWVLFIKIIPGMFASFIEFLERNEEGIYFDSLKFEGEFWINNFNY